MVQLNSLKLLPSIGLMARMAHPTRHVRLPEAKTTMMFKRRATAKDTAVIFKVRHVPFDRLNSIGTMRG